MVLAVSYILVNEWINQAPGEEALKQRAVPNLDRSSKGRPFGAAIVIAGVERQDVRA